MHYLHKCYHAGYDEGVYNKEAGDIVDDVRCPHVSGPEHEWWWAGWNDGVNGCIRAYQPKKANKPSTE